LGGGGGATVTIRAGTGEGEYYWWDNKAIAEIEDGNLTAAEMNLVGTKVAVLLACQTGLGE
jgi:hypothetical protein